MESGDGVNQYNKGKDTAKFTAIRIDIFRMAWGNMCAYYTMISAASVLEYKGSSAKVFLVGSVADCNGAPADQGLR